MARPFNLHEDNILLARRERGDTWESIAKYLNRHSSSVKERWSYLKEPIYTSSQLNDDAMRTCLGPICRGMKKFKSAHKGERICRSCRQSIDRSGVTTQFGSAV